MIRVLHITARSDPGGGPAVIQTMLERIGPPIEHHVAGPEDPPYGPRFVELVGRDRMVSIPPRRFQAASWLRLAAHIRQRGIHVLHSHGFGAGLYGRSLALLLRVPVVHSYHGFLIPEHGRAGMLVRLCAEAVLAPLTTAGVTCSQSECARMCRLLPFPPANLSVVANGLDADNVRVNTAARSAPARFLVLAVGRLSHQKNPEALIRIASQLEQVEPALDFCFRIVGDGPKREAARELARVLGIGHRVEFVGAARAADWLGQSDVFLSASRGEGMPLALLEAMAARLPIVASQVVGNLDLVSQDETGYLFPPEEHRTAALALARLARNAPLRARFGDKARQRVLREFTIERFAASYSAIYRELADRRVGATEAATTP